MKALLVLSLIVAAVSAEADPQFYYGLGLNSYLHPYGYAPYVVAPAKAEEAEAEAEEPAAAPAAPVVLPYAAYPYAYPYAAPLVYTAHTGCQNHQGAAVPCAYGSLVPVAAEAAEGERKKREATAEADAEADPFYYYAPHYYSGYRYAAPYRYAHYGYAHYAPYHYSAAVGCRNNYGSLVPCA